MSNNPCVNRWWYWCTYKGYAKLHAQGIEAKKHEHRYKKPSRWKRFKHPTRRD